MAKKRRGQWFGDRRAQTVEQIPAIVDVIQLLPPASALESIRDIVFERCVLNFSVSRLTTAVVTDMYWMAYKGKVGQGTVIPLEALNPRSAAQTTMATADIVQVGALPTPPVIHAIDSAGVSQGTLTTREVSAMTFDFHVKRSINRGSEGIFLTVACSADEAITLDVMWRTYYTYA